MPVPSLQRWTFCQALGWTVILISAAGKLATEGSSSWIFALVGAAMLATLATLWIVARVDGRIADFVTVVRFLGLLAVGYAAVAGGEITVGIWVGAVAVVLGDLADGWAARRFGGSEAGALLDMETDQLVTLGLALLVAGFTGVGIWILLLPGYKYLYALLLHIAGIAAHDPKPRDGDNSRGRIICAATMVLLLVALAPFVASSLGAAAGVLAVVLLGYSFGSDAWFLLRRGKNGGSIG